MLFHFTILVILLFVTGGVIKAQFQAKVKQFSAKTSERLIVEAWLEKQQILKKLKAQADQ